MAERFLTEAPKSWEQFRKLSLHSEGTLKFVHYDCLDNHRVVRREEISITLDGENVRVGRVENDEPLPLSVANPKYSFELEKNIVRRVGHEGC